MVGWRGIEGGAVCRQRWLRWLVAWVSGWMVSWLLWSGWLDVVLEVGANLDSELFEAVAAFELGLAGWLEGWLLH